MKHLIFHVVFFSSLCFSMSPFDLICSFGLVMAKQLIQQTCLMRCEACTQIQRSYPLPTFQLTGGRRHSPAQTLGRMEASLFEPETGEADQRSVIHNTCIHTHRESTFPLQKALRCSQVKSEKKNPPCCAQCTIVFY